MKFAVGTYTSLGGPGIALCERTGDALRMTAAFDLIGDPIWLLSPDEGILFAACEDKADGRGMVASFRISEGEVRMTAFQPSLGRACCHIALDSAGRTLYAANYLDASVTVFPVENGRVLPAVQHIPHTGSGPNKMRQAEAHVHQIVLSPDEREAFVCDLGADRVAVYAREKDGRLRETGSIPAPAGSGPRHLLFSSPDAFYLVGEVDSTVSFYRRENGAWTRVITRPTLPENDPAKDKNTAAALRLCGGTLYVSNRGHDSLAAFALDAAGVISAPRFIPAPGKCPRDFIAAKDGFLFAHQVSGGVALTDGTGAVKSSLPMSGAVCVCPLYGG